VFSYTSPCGTSPKVNLQEEAATYPIATFFNFYMESFLGR